MPFVLPDLVVESILRDGFQNARRREEVIDDVFANLSRAFADKKYGEKEINKIKKLTQDSEVSIVHSFGAVESSIPCISIQLIKDTEDTAKAHLGDFEQMEDIPFEDQSKTVIVASFTSSAYNPVTGIISLPDSVNLSAVYANLLFIDNAGESHTIIGGIDNTLGSKKIQVAINSEVTVGAGCEIKTSINFNRYLKRGNMERVNILLGIHTKDALTTKYIYTLVKYFLLSRKKDLISRDMQLATYDGSDFNRNMEYRADMVYSRYITVSGMVQHDWRSDLVELVDNVEVQLLVPADKYGNEVLELEDQTIKTNKE